MKRLVLTYTSDDSFTQIWGFEGKSYQNLRSGHKKCTKIHQTNI